MREDPVLHAGEEHHRELEALGRVQGHQGHHALRLLVGIWDLIGVGDQGWDDLPEPPAIREWDESRVTDSDEEVVIKQNWTEIRRFMWNYVGIVRTTKRLERAANRIRLLKAEVEDYYGSFRVTTDLIELRNLLQAADLIVQSALRRHESRGLHYTLDHPATDPVAKDTVLVP